MGSTGSRRPAPGGALRVALVAGPDPGHALPTVALARALRDRGHAVTVATGPGWRGDLEAEGLGWVDLPLLAPTPHDADVGYRIWHRAADMAAPLADALEDLRPDVVVCDVLTRAGAFAAELLGAPWVELSPHFLYDPSPAVPPVGMGARPPRTPWGRRDQRAIRRRQVASFAAGRRQARAARARLGLAGDERPLGRLLATLPDLEYRRPDWPDDAYVVGALAWEPASWPLLVPPRGAGPLVLVSDSTASTVERSLAQTAVDALAGGALRLVVTTQADVTVPDRTRVVAGRSRHLPLLASTDLVVATAGHGLVAKALSAGVPLVVVPIQGDQRETATRLGVAGLGRAIPPRRLTTSRLRAVVREALEDPGLAQQAREAAARAARLGPGRAARLVEDLVAAAGQSSAAASSSRSSGRSTPTS